MARRWATLLALGAAACSSGPANGGPDDGSDAATASDSPAPADDSAASTDGGEDASGADSSSTDAPVGTDDAPVTKVPIGTSPVRGPGDAWVTLVEFGDFECPFCGEEEPVVEALLAMYPADLRLVWKNFPLTTIHPYAQGAAIAAECADEQGLFWPMHDLLYANQNALTSTDLTNYAGQVQGLDVATWQACLSTAPPAQGVSDDVALGTMVGVGGTPTFFVNGEAVVGAVPQATLQGVIETKRAEAEASGVPRAQYYDTVILGM
jgi:protein-disulfide isomerase